MTLRDHFHSFLDEVRQEDRYRSFINLERHAARPPYATGIVTGLADRSSSGARTIISAWGVTPPSSMR